MRFQKLLSFLLVPVLLTASFSTALAAEEDLEPTPAVTSAAVGEPIDLLVVLAHAGDESLFFSGLLADYSAEQRYSTAVVYLAEPDAVTRAQAEENLAVLGVDKVVFGNFKDGHTDTLENTKLRWDEDAAIAFFVEQIRALKPQVIVTHDINGEYGSGNHSFVADCMQKAVLLSASTKKDAEDFADSATRYGLWQVQRMFLHLHEAETVISIDQNAPLAAFDGKSALEVDTALYETYAQAAKWGRRPAASGHTRADFGEVFTAEGLAPATESLFDGLDAAKLTGPDPVTPSPEPTAVPTPSPTPAATAVPTPTPAANPTFFSSLFALSPFALAALGLAALLILAVILLPVFFLLTRRKRSGKKQHLLFLLETVLCFAAAALLLLVPRLPGREAAPSPTPVPTPAPTATAEPTATPDPDPEPTATPDPWAQYFRQEGEPEEVVLIDAKAGHWEYRTDTLSIIIDREHTLNIDDIPISYCVANVRMRENAYFSGLYERNDCLHGWQMTRKYRAVLGITGDNITYSEAHKKGIIIRNGEVYNERDAASTLAFYPDLSLRIFMPNEITAEQLLSDGVTDTYSFGPALVVNDMMLFDPSRLTLGPQNPRCGIGMIEPGHFVLITVDGRNLRHSRGISVDSFKQLFYMYGCSNAYNLDGGSSTAMVFMGEHLNMHNNGYGDYSRRLPDMLLFGKSELVPTVDDPVFNKGYGPLY